MEEKYQDRKDNSEIWYWTINDELSINQTYTPILNTLNEYFYCVYCLATTKNNSELTFTNINFNGNKPNSNFRFRNFTRRYYK